MTLPSDDPPFLDRLDIHTDSLRDASYDPVEFMLNFCCTAASFPGRSFIERSCRFHRYQDSDQWRSGGGSHRAPHLFRLQVLALTSPQRTFLNGISLPDHQIPSKNNIPLGFRFFPRGVLGSDFNVPIRGSTSPQTEDGRD